LECFHSVTKAKQQQQHHQQKRSTMSQTEEWRRAGPRFDDKRSNQESSSGGWRRTGSGSGDGKSNGEAGWRRSNSGQSRNRLNPSSSKGDDKKGDDKEVEEAAENIQDVQLEEGAEKDKSTTGGGNRQNGRGERRFREPEVVNSRAAMLGEAAAPRKEVGFTLLLLLLVIRVGGLFSFPVLFCCCFIVSCLNLV
jgi:hypothetical protein